jgi:sugar phosphate isomerase/epimerase
LPEGAKRRTPPRLNLFMKIDQVALQLYTLRDYLKTPADIRVTLKKVKAIGYPAVQVSGLGPIPEAELVEILHGEGLVLCATHEPGDVIRKTPEKVVERLAKLGCRYTAYPWPAGVDWSKPEDIKSLVTDLDHAGAVLRQAGQVLCYHNHGVELTPVQGTTALDYIYRETHPLNLQGEIDTYWIQYGGADPVAWCRQLKGRLPLLHLKDYTVKTDGQPTFASVGAGNLNWPAILAAAGDSGCEWYIVEQDTTPGDPFDAVRQSLDYIREHLI